MNRANMNRWALLALLPLCAAASMATAKNPPTENKDGRTDSHQPGTDTWITTKVKADLLATEHVPGMEIKVETVNGTVMLSGTVNKQAEKDRAVAVARGIEGVKQVDAANLRVTGNPAG
jgi:hyperosmotically inducible protein